MSTICVKYPATFGTTELRREKMQAGFSIIDWMVDANEDPTRVK
jgi:hypothetical protein